jgi:hypothetical protein
LLHRGKDIKEMNNDENYGLDLKPRFESIFDYEDRQVIEYIDETIRALRVENEENEDGIK